MRHTSTSPPGHILRKRDRLLFALTQGQHWSELGGRQLKHGSGLIAFRLGLYWRLLWRPESGSSETLSHREYTRRCGLRHLNQPVRDAVS